MGAINLRIASTMAKLEDWVSDPKNSQKLIDDLKKKLAQGEMEALEDYLRHKKLKRSLRFYADDVDKIKNNDELGWFLDVMNGTKFPTSLLDLFFQRNTDYNPPNNLKMEVHPEIYTDFRNDPFVSKNNDLFTSGRENVASNQQRNTSTSGVANEGKREPSPSDNAPSATNKNNMLLDWAVKQSGVSEKELSQVLENISIRNVVEHSEYQFFVAENVMVYKKPETGEQEILVVTDENSVRMTNLIHYQMFVSNIHKSIVLRPEEPKEQHIKYNETLVPTNLCLRCISELFLPALAVFKRVQRKEKFPHQKTNE